MSAEYDDDLGMQVQDPVRMQVQDPVRMQVHDPEFNYYNTWKKNKPAVPAKQRVLVDVFEKDYLPVITYFQSQMKAIPKDINAIYDVVYGGVPVKKDTDEYYTLMIKKIIPDINRLLDALKAIAQELNIDFAIDYIKQEEEYSHLGKKMPVEDIFQASYWSGIVPEPPASRKSNPLRLFQNDYSEIKRYEKSAEPAVNTVDPMVVLQFNYINPPSSKRTYFMALVALFHKLQLFYIEFLNYKLKR
jgi:hypothetical protein